MNLRLVLCSLALAVAAPAAFAKDAPKAPASKGAAHDGKGGAAADPKHTAMMEAWEKFMTPGEMHKWLVKTTSGKWTVSTKMWMGPGEPQTSTGTAEVKAVLGDRYVMEEHAGTFMGKPFNGMGFTGYDNAKKKFVSSWVDNAGTGIMTSEGMLSEDHKTLTATSTSTDPMSGGAETMRVVDHFDSDGHRMTEFFQKGPDGKEMKMMEITYVRK